MSGLLEIAEVSVVGQGPSKSKLLSRKKKALWVLNHAYHYSSWGQFTRIISLFHHPWFWQKERKPFESWN